MKTLIIRVRNFSIAPFSEGVKAIGAKTKVVSLALTTAFGIISIDMSFRNASDSIYGPLRKIEKVSASASLKNEVSNIDVDTEEVVTVDTTVSDESASYNDDHGMYSFERVRLGFIGDYSYQLSFLPKFELEQKLKNSFPKKLRAKVGPYIKPTLVICEKYQVDPFWVLSVMWTESHFKPWAKSHVGARGLMQIMPRTKQYLLEQAEKESIVFEYQKGDDYLNYIFPLYAQARGKKTKSLLQSKMLNIELGVLYLKKLLIFFNNSHLHATVAYNMGPGWTKKRLRLKRAVGVNNRYLNKVKKAYDYILTQFKAGSGSV